MRRPFAGGAPAALLVIALLAAGCGSSGAPAGGTADHRDLAPTVAARAHLGSGGSSRTPRTDKHRRVAASGGSSSQRARPAHHAVPVPRRSGQRSSATTHATEMCEMTIAGRTISVPCQLKPMLQGAAKQNPGLAGFLAPAARSR